MKRYNINQHLVIILNGKYIKQQTNHFKIKSVLDKPFTIIFRLQWTNFFLILYEIWSLNLKIEKYMFLQLNTFLALLMFLKPKIMSSSRGFLFRYVE